MQFAANHRAVSRLKPRLLRQSTLGPLLMVAMLALEPPAVDAQPTVITVDENNANGWAFFDDIAQALLPNDFVVGPGTPPRGSGSAHLAVAIPAEGILIGTQNHEGTRLGDLTALSYSTYQNISPQAISLQFSVDYDDTDASTAFQGRLVFEPSNIVPSVTVLTNTWQAWNALDASARWWSTRDPIVGGATQAILCTQGSPCDWSTILSNYPNVAIPTGLLAGIFLKAGSGWTGFDGAVDDFRIATVASPPPPPPATGPTTDGPPPPTFDVIYDFETIVPVELQSFAID
ncbi:MAG: hypothetical protein AAF657_30715 [Acidobacteriota bacterium]